MTDQRPRPSPDPAHPIYAISVVAELTGAAVQSIRLWEQRGLLTPHRSAGGTRRYSADDLSRIARIAALVDAGVNIAGIARILDLEDDNAALRSSPPAKLGEPASPTLIAPEHVGGAHRTGAPIPGTTADRATSG